MQLSTHLPAAPADATQSYLAHRSTYNAHRRWLYSLLVLALVAVYELVYFATDRVHFDGTITADEHYPLAFVLLGAVAALGATLGRRPRPAWADDAWIALLLSGMAVLAILDSAGYQVTAYVLISLPAAVLYSAPPRRMVALQVLALLAIGTGVLSMHPLSDPVTITFLVTLAVCFVAAVWVGIHVEQARHEEFLAAQALASANLELEHRSLLLAQTNAQLETGNRALGERSQELARVNAELQSRGKALEEANRRLEQLAMTDPLTGVANRRLLFEILDHEFSRARRYGHALAIAVVDLDDFGQVNKLHGVIAGDEVLAGFASLLRDRLRGADAVGRYGGEEFVVLMPDSSAAAAEQLLERVRTLVAETPFGTRKLPITFSAGIAILGPDDTDPLDLLKRADEALRRAKADGKNRVLCA